MRPIWKGAISFGMVTIPIKLYAATESRDVRFRLLHRDDGAPIEEKRFCTADGKEVGWDDLVRGYEVAKGQFVVLEPDEIEAAKPESSTTIEIGDFVEVDAVDPVYFEKSYFLEPQEVGTRAFSLLKRALEETRRVAVARVTIRTRERLAVVRPYDGTLVLETIFWPDEIRSTGSLDLPEGDEAKVRPKELDMARSLVDSLADRFKPDEYTDAYRGRLEELIEQKMKGEVRATKRRRPEPKVVDLMAALEASVEKARGRRTSGQATTGKKAVSGKRQARVPKRSAAKRTAA